MIQTPRRRLVRLSAAVALAITALLPAAAPAAAGGARRPPRGHDAGPIETSNPWNSYLVVRVRGVPADLQPADRLRQGRQARRPGFADTWERSPDRVTFHIRDGMKWSDGTPATAKDVCFSWGLALAGDQGREVHRLRVPRARAEGRGRHQDRVPRRLHVRRLHDRPVGPDLPDLRPDPSRAHLRRQHLQGHRRGEVRRAARRHRPVHAGGVEDQPVRAVRAQPQLLGRAGLRRRGRAAVLPRRRRHDGPGAQVGRARLRPRRQPGPVQAAPDRPGLHRGRRARPTAGPSSRSTPTAPGTGKTIEDGGPSTKALLDPAFRDALGYAVDKEQLVERVLGGFGDVGTTNVPPILERLARRARPPPHLRPRARQAEARGGGLRPQRRWQAPRQGRQADRPSPGLPEHQTTSTRSPRSSCRSGTRELGIDVYLQAFGSDSAGQPRAAAGRRRRQGRTTTSSSGDGPAARTRNALLEVFRCDADRHLVRQPVLQPGLRRPLRQAGRRGRRRPARRRSRRCRT